MRKIQVTNLAPMLIYALCDDGFGNLIDVSAIAWEAAFYHVHQRMAGL